MDCLINKTIIFKTTRKVITNKSLNFIFPEHIFTAVITAFIGDFALIQNIKLLFSENNYRQYRKTPTILARDKLFNNNNCAVNNKNTCLIKIANNLYFNVIIYTPNIDLLNSIRTHIWTPKLYNICFYKLSTLETNFILKLLPNASYSNNNYNLNLIPLNH